MKTSQKKKLPSRIVIQKPSLKTATKDTYVTADEAAKVLGLRGVRYVHVLRRDGFVHAIKVDDLWYYNLKSLHETKVDLRYSVAHPNR
jgi:hypothetical protein